ncbi:MAG TPA: Gfo/Idh/MocA family oxidoreductase, partial [Steroidobacteraceae bacterium]
MKVVLAGAGAFGTKHLDAIKQIGGIDVVSVVGRELPATQDVARKYGVPHATTDLAEALRQPGVDAAILATPTQMHAAQAIQCLEAGKHVQVEIPLADSWKDAAAVDALARKSGLVAMV